MTSTRSKSWKTLWGQFVALAGVITFLTVVVVLHLIQDGYDPVYQLMSELALGNQGWAMLIAFSGLAAGPFGILLALTHHGVQKWYRVLLFVIGPLYLGSGVFSLKGAPEIHIFCIALAFVLMGLAMYIFPSQIAEMTRSVSWWLVAAMTGSVALGHSFMPIGIAQRLATVWLLLWIAWVSKALMAIRNKA